MTQIKKIPMRKCVVTGEQAPKSSMFRIVRTNEGQVLICKDGKTKGHGVYVKKDLKVIEQARKKKLLDKALEVHVDDAIYDELEEMLKNE